MQVKKEEEEELKLNIAWTEALPLIYGLVAV